MMKLRNDHMTRLQPTPEITRHVRDIAELEVENARLTAEAAAMRKSLEGVTRLIVAAIGLVGHDVRIGLLMAQESISAALATDSGSALLAEMEALRARIAELEAALEPFAEFNAAMDRNPIRGLDPEEIYSIHGGWPCAKDGGATLRRSWLRNAAAALERKAGGKP